MAATSGATLRPQAPPPEPVVVRLDAAVVERFVDAADGAAVQVPDWARVKPGWDGETLGVRDGTGRLVATALVLHRRVPGVRASFAYVPEGPVTLPDADPAAVLAALTGHLRRGGAFAVRVGPRAVLRTWTARTVRDGIAAGAATLRDLPPDGLDPAGVRWTDTLRGNGFRPCPADLGDGQPVHVVTLDVAGRDADALRAGMNQQWRRNLARATARGVEVRVASPADVEAFEDLYTETARRQGFTPRPRGYLTGLLAALGDRARLDVAAHDGVVLAGALTVRTGGRLTYLYGASTARDRDVRAPNALHGAIAVRAAAEGCRVYDLRGVEPGLREDDPGAGMLRFKAGLGGTAVEYVGEWERVLRPSWYALYRGLRALQRVRASRRRLRSTR